MQYENRYKKEVTDSYLNMWRLVVCAVHVDEEVAEEETKMVEHYLEELNFNEDHINLLKKELRHPASIDDILPKITDSADRSQAVYFVRLLLWKDHILTDSEKTFLKKVQDHFMKQVDMANVQKSLSKLNEEYETQRETNVLDFLSDTSLSDLLKKIKNKLSPNNS